MSLKMSPKISIKKLGLMKTVLKTDKNYANNLKHKQIKKQPNQYRLQFCLQFRLQFHF